MKTFQEWWDNLNLDETPQAQNPPMQSCDFAEIGYEGGRKEAQLEITKLQIDFRKLLFKYMAEVIDCESVCYIPCDPDSSFTQNDIAELNKIHTEIKSKAKIDIETMMIEINQDSGVACAPWLANGQEEERQKIVGNDNIKKYAWKLPSWEIPVIIQYLNLLYKYQDPEHKKIKKLMASNVDDADFIRRAAILRRIFIISKI